jgi:hypothetical protein
MTKVCDDICLNASLSYGIDGVAPEQGKLPSEDADRYKKIHNYENPFLRGMYVICVIEFVLSFFFFYFILFFFKGFGLKMGRNLF